MHLVADVLDEQLRDSRGTNAGRIDGIVLELRDDRPPRIAYLEVSPITLLARFSIRLAHWYARNGMPGSEDGRGVLFRIPWSRSDASGHRLCRCDIDTVRATPINALDDWLSRNVVRRIPGG